MHILNGGFTVLSFSQVPHRDLLRFGRHCRPNGAQQSTRSNYICSPHYVIVDTLQVEHFSGVLYRFDLRMHEPGVTAKKADLERARLGKLSRRAAPTAKRKDGRIQTRFGNVTLRNEPLLRRSQAYEHDVTRQGKARRSDTCTISSRRRYLCAPRFHLPRTSHS